MRVLVPSAIIPQKKKGTAIQFLKGDTENFSPLPIFHFDPVKRNELHGRL